MSDLFGAKISAATHGVMIAVWSAAGIIGIPIFGSFTAKYYHLNTKGAKIPDAGAYIDNAYWLCGLPALSFVALLFMNVRVRDRRLRQVSEQRAVADGWRALPRAGSSSRYRAHQLIHAPSVPPALSPTYHRAG